jgi:hypothetical protein
VRSLTPNDFCVACMALKCEPRLTSCLPWRDHRRMAGLLCCQARISFVVTSFATVPQWATVVTTSPWIDSDPYFAVHPGWRHGSLGQQNHPLQRSAHHGTPLTYLDVR